MYDEDYASNGGYSKESVSGSIQGNTSGNIQGNIKGNIPGNIQGDTPGNIQGDPPRNIPGNTSGSIPVNVQGNVQGNGPVNIPGNYRTAPGNYNQAPGNYGGTGPSIENRPSGPPPGAGFTPQREPKPRKSGMGYGKKVLAVISLGLFFGIFGGLGFQAVSSVAGFLGGSVKWPVGRAADVPEESAVEAIGDAAGETDVISGVNSTGVVDNTKTVSAVVTDVTEVVEAVMPAVVSINNNYTETYGDFFGRTYTDEGQSSGSGIIIGENDSELLIVTNDHVIYDEYDSGRLEIQFMDGSIAPAQVKGRDSDMDLAVLAVNRADIAAATLDNIAIATLGDSDALAVGEPAIAIGNAMGYGQSVTTGVISALDRESSYSTGATEVSSTFIQTDAAINPGNSGGALLNIKGEVIGINSNKAGGSLIEGMGYAIPISAAKPIIADLMVMQTRNKVAQEERGYMGITGGMTLVDEYVESYNLPKGVYITQVTPGTPAEEAGLRKGDIITAIDGVEVLGWNELQAMMGYYAVGDVIELRLMRGDAMGGYTEETVSLQLGPRPEVPAEGYVEEGQPGEQPEVQPEILPGEIPEDIWNGFFD